MNDATDQTQHRLEHASPEVLQAMLDQAQRQLAIHQRAANNTHQTRAKREQAAIKCDQCRTIISRMQSAQKKQAEAKAKTQANKARQEQEHLKLARRPFQKGEHFAQWQQLETLEHNLTRAISNTAEFKQRADNAKSDQDRTRNQDLADYWQKRADNAESRINEWIVMHQDDACKPWLKNDQAEPGQLH